MGGLQFCVIQVNALLCLTIIAGLEEGLQGEMRFFEIMFWKDCEDNQKGKVPLSNILF
jgi:hypothetical protein